MRVNGLVISYENGMNIFTRGSMMTKYPVGDLLCRIFQGETLDNITRILRNCINYCPMKDNILTQDEIEAAEHYILEALLYDDFIPAQRLAQGSFVRCMERCRALDSKTATRFLYEERARAAMNYMLEKLEKLENKDAILNAGYKIVDDLLKNSNLNDSEKLMAIELAMAKLNYELYHISGDENA